MKLESGTQRMTANLIGSNTHASSTNRASGRSSMAMAKDMGGKPTPAPARNATTHQEA